MHRSSRGSRGYRRLVVELLETRRLLAFDFGDAPTSYPVTSADDGARHASTLEWEELGGQVNSGWVASLSADGATLAVGEPYTDGGGLALDVGRARIYRREAGAWRQLGGDIDGQNGHDGFGWSLALSEYGDTVAIGAPYNDGNGNDSGQTRIFRWNGASWQQLGDDIDGEEGSDSFAPGDRSGWSISLSADGNTVAIGAPFNDGNGTDAGHTRVYRWDGSAWRQLGADIDGENELLFPPSSGDQSGWSVSLSADGNRVAIGAPHSDGEGKVSSGHARIFSWNGSTWQQLGGDIDGDEAGDQLGWSVSLSADGATLAVGAPMHDVGELSTGYTRIYRWNGAAWQSLGDDIDGEGRSSSFDLGLCSQCSWSVSLSADGDTVAIGSSYNNGNGYAVVAGHTRIFRWDGSAWLQLGSDIDGPIDSQGQGRFGRSVRLSGDGMTVAVGRTIIAGGGFGGGDFNAVQVYRWGELGWKHLGSELDGAHWDKSGWSVSTSEDGNTVAIGAPYNDGNGEAAGHARVYRWDGAAWRQLGANLDGRPSYWGHRSPARSSRISVSLSADGGTVAIGAAGQGVPVHGGDGDDYGLTRIFRWDGAAWRQLGEDILGEIARVDLPLDEKGGISGWSVALSSHGDTVAIGAPYNDGNGDEAGHTRVYRWDGSSWRQMGGDIDGVNYQSLPVFQRQFDYSGASVALSDDGDTLAIGAPGIDSLAGLTNALGHTRIYRWDGSAWRQLGAEIVSESTGDRSGWSVSLDDDGDTVAIGAPSKDINGFTGHTRVYRWEGSTWRQMGGNIEAQASNERSGWSVSLSGNGETIAIGAPANSENGVFKGLTRVYGWDGSDWTQLGGDLVGETNVDYSGWSVSLSGDGATVSIGAPFNDDGNSYDLGHTRVYRWNGSAWVQLGADIDGEVSGDGFGASVAVSADGTTVAVGAPNVLGDGINQGSRTRVYRRDGAVWRQLGLDIDGEANRDHSGWSVALSADGNVVAIGAPFNDGNGDESGHTRIYRWDGLVWGQMGGDIDGWGDGEFSGDQSGWSVSLSADGETVAIGAPGDDTGSFGALDGPLGHTRIYRWNGSAWRQLGSDIDGEEERDRSGWSVSLSADGGTVAIGAPRNTANGVAAGHTRIYRWDGSAWRQLGGDLDGEAASDEAGRSVSLSGDGNTVAIGAPGNDGDQGEENSGHARVYRWDGSAWGQLGADIDGEVAGDAAGFSVSLSADGETLARGAPGGAEIFLGEDFVGPGQTQVYRWDGSTWRKLGSDLAGRPFWRGSGRSVALTADGGAVVTGANEVALKAIATLASPFRLTDGPSHGYARVFHLPPLLGANKDTEADGQPSMDASGDGDDEDGIVFGSILGGRSSSVEVTVSGSGGLLDAWMDFDADGDWNDPGEQVFADEPVNVGVNQLSFDVPTDAVGGGVFSRFRISTSGGLANTGAAADGEVEDHALDINALPTLDSLSDLSIDEDAPEQTVNLAGISAGVGESQPLKVTASSDDRGLIPHPSVDYETPNATGSIAFTPVADQSGTATITVTVEDGGLDNDLQTAADNNTFSRTFDVTVNAINDDPTLDPISDPPGIPQDAAEQTISLSGITAGGGESQPLRVEAQSANASVLTPLVVDYASAETTGRLRFSPAATGTTTITVTVTDGGLDEDLDTPDDNASFQRQFQVEVDAPQFPWHNARSVYDIDADGDVDLVDGFVMINELRTRGIGAQLPPEGPGPNGPFVDINKNNRMDIQDAFLLIDELRRRLGGNGEAEGEFTFWGDGLPSSRQAALRWLPLAYDVAFQPDDDWLADLDVLGSPDDEFEGLLRSRLAQ